MISVKFALFVILASLMLLVAGGRDAEAHDGAQGVISWADIHWNASATNHLEYDFYYTGHEGCQGNDACVFYVLVDSMGVRSDLLLGIRE